MAKKRSQGDSGGPDDIIPFDQEKEKFMGMIGDVLANKDFSSMEEANKFLNEAFMGRTMSESLAEWDTRPATPLDEAREVLNGMPKDCSPATEKSHAKKALEISRDCMEAWQTLAWSYRSPAKIESTLLEGIEHGRNLHKDLISEVGEDHGLWGYHEARPFMRLLHSLAEFYREENAEESIKVLEEMIALNPGDNQGVRGELVHRYLCLQRLDDAEKLLVRYDDDIDLGIVYGRVLLELLRVVHSGYDFEGLARKSRISPGDFGPPFAKAKARMREALRLNAYVPLLMNHPTSLYLESPTTYQIGSPEQALIFINDHGVDWMSSMIGFFFLGAYQNQAKVQINKASRQMRETYKSLISYLDGIDEPPWQSVVMEKIDKLR